MGGNLILIKISISEKSTGEMLEDFDEWTSYWFEWVRPWRDIDVNQYRSIWTRWYGVPMHVWSIRFFSIASAKLGMFIKLDDVQKIK